ncbi:MAG TPA: hypothetical protein VIC06_06865 [Solirubrobacteraceae bacterium]|jgi:hypothetical protein
MQSAIAKPPCDTEEAETALCAYILANHPCAHTTFDGAVQNALIAAPAAEDEEELAAFLAMALGSNPTLLDVIEQPKHCSYVLQIDLINIRIAATDAPDLAAHLAFRTKHPDVDALWLPDDDATQSNSRLRLITQRSLLGHLTLVRSTRIPARTRPLA